MTINYSYPIVQTSQRTSYFERVAVAAVILAIRDFRENPKNHHLRSWLMTIGFNWASTICRVDEAFWMPWVDQGCPVNNTEISKA